MDLSLIEEKRIKQNLTVTEVCKMANISRKTYYKVIANPNKSHFTTIEKIVDALNFTASEKSRLFK